MEASSDDGTLLIFDCGTGARRLGHALAESGHPVRAHLFISHTHADHIQGLPFFLPAFVPGSHITVYGPAGIDRSLPRAVGGQMDYAYFPMPLEELPARFDFVELGESNFAVDGVAVRTQFLNHTAPCLGYRITAGGATFVYATDHEAHANPPWRPGRAPSSFDPEQLVHPGDVRHAAFLRDADLVVHDAQYWDDDYPSKAGWGHSTIEYAVDLALAAGARRVALFHHDPGRDDEGVDRLLAAARDRAKASGRSLEVMAAAEGDVFEFDETASAQGGGGGPRAARMPTRARLLLVDDDPETVKVLETMLAADGYEIDSALDGTRALAKATEGTYDILLLDIRMPGLDGIEVCRRLRSNDRYRTTPIIMVTARTRHEDMVDAFAAGVTDYIRKPFAVAQVRARVRSWLSRSADRG
ncbi:MAG TPA: response regulator [Candidatus Limnocylindria bacterium]|nr:response regulator [Candidatus Limnocylindria bacterium]